MTGRNGGKYVLSLCILFLLISTASCTGKKEGLDSGNGSPAGMEKGVLATVNDEKITMEGLRHTLETDSGEKHIFMTSPSEEGYLISYLNRKGIEKIFYLESVKEGIEPPDLAEKLDLDSKFLTKFEYLVEVAKKVRVPESLVDEKMPARLVKIKLQELIVEDAGSARKALERAHKGEAFDDLVAELSIGPAAHKKGVMSYIWYYPYNGIFDEKQSERLFNLKKNEVSSVIYTPLGYGIYKLLDRQELGESGRDIVRASIKKSVREDMILEEIKRIYDNHRVWSINEPKDPKKFYALFEEWYLKKIPIEEVSRKVVAKVDDKEIDFGKVLYADSMIPRQSGKMGKIDLFAHFQTILDKVVKSYVMSAEAESRGFTLSPYSMKELGNKEERIRANYFFETRFRKWADLSEDAVKKYYRDNREKFSPGESANFHYVYVSKREKVPEIYNLISDGMKFEDVSKKLSDSFPIGPGPSPGYLNRDDFSREVADKIFALSIGEVSRPIPYEGGLLVVKISDKRRTKANDYENVRESVKSDYERSLKKTYFVQLYNELKGKYKFKLNEKGKAGFIEELKKMKKRFGKEQKLKKGIHH